MFGVVEPKTGRVDFEVTERHTKLDFAFAMKRLVDELYPHAERWTGPDLWTKLIGDSTQGECTTAGGAAGWTHRPANSSGVR